MFAMAACLATAAEPQKQVIAPSAPAAAPKPPQPQPQQLTREESLALENLQLRFTLLQNSTQELQREVCVNHSIPLESCVLDQNTRTVSAKPAAPPRPVTAPAPAPAKEVK